MKIDELRESDFGDWKALWCANNLGQIEPDVTAETWLRLMNPDVDVYGLVARDGQKISGFLHYILHFTTGHIAPVCYMQDVYVEPSDRHRGIGRQLVEHLVRIGKKEKWARMYWLAESGNEAAQNLYKNIGIKLDFTLHVMPL